MFLFIATIFIAELIIVWTLISKIVKVDKVVKKLQNDVLDIKPQLSEALVGLRVGIHQIKEKKDNFVDIVSKKSSRYIMSALVSVVLYFALFIVRRKSRKIAQVVQGMLVAKEVWDSFLAWLYCQIPKLML